MTIKFEELKIGQEVWLDGEKNTVIEKKEWFDGAIIFREIRLSCRLYIRYCSMDWDRLSLTPPKKKVKKTIERWVNVYPDGREKVKIKTHIQFRAINEGWIILPVNGIRVEANGGIRIVTYENSYYFISREVYVKLKKELITGR